MYVKIFIKMVGVLEILYMFINIRKILKLFFSIFFWIRRYLLRVGNKDVVKM